MASRQQAGLEPRVLRIESRWRRREPIRGVAADGYAFRRVLWMCFFLGPRRPAAGFRRAFSTKARETFAVVAAFLRDRVVDSSRDA